MTEGAAAREITPLEERLIALIKSRGPITVADYMEDALLHPHDGYYTSQAPIGAKGDFTTAPEISQIFGELIGLWLVQSWTDMGSPADFNLIELGPGRGVLMQDILRAARLRPAFLDAAHVWLVETSGRLRHEQQRRLRDAGIATDWADGLADTPPAPSLGQHTAVDPVVVHAKPSPHASAAFGSQLSTQTWTSPDAAHIPDAQSSPLPHTLPAPPGVNGAGWQVPSVPHTSSSPQSAGPVHAGMFVAQIPLSELRPQLRDGGCAA